MMVQRLTFFLPFAHLRAAWVLGAALGVGAARVDVIGAGVRPRAPSRNGPGATESLWPGSRWPTLDAVRAVSSDARAAADGETDIELVPSKSSDADAHGEPFRLTQFVFGTDAASFFRSEVEPALIKRRVDCETWGIEQTWWKDATMLLPYFYRVTQCGSIGNTATIVDCSTGSEGMLNIDQEPLELRDNRTLSLSVNFGELPERLDLKRAEWRGSLSTLLGDCKPVFRASLEFTRKVTDMQASWGGDSPTKSLKRRMSIDLPSIIEAIDESEAEED